MAVPGMTGAPGATGAGAAGRAGAGPVGVPPGAEEDLTKKGIDPKLIGAGGFLVVAGLFAFFMSNRGGGETVLPEGNTINPPVDIPAPAPPPVGNTNVPGFTGSTATVAQAVVPLPFTLVVPPNPQYATGTAGILATQPNISSAQAAGLARFAKNQLTRTGRWRSMQICVFTNQQTAQLFGTFQNRRRSAPLTGGDFQTLAAQGIWAGTAAYLQTSGNSERVLTPSSNPNSWWGSLGR